MEIRQVAKMHWVGFEPTHPKILRPERSALDHSATNATSTDWKIKTISEGFEPPRANAHLISNQTP